MISIIIPFYNTEKYFEECLSSIKAQTFSDYECLLIDDGSTDTSREIAKRYADQDHRFILLNEKHIGYPACKNLGLDVAKGEYVCFIDSDDYVSSNYLADLYDALISTNSDISNCEYQQINKPNKKEAEINNVETFEGPANILRKYFSNSYPWCKLFKKSLWEGLRFREDVEALSDTLLNYKVFERANKTVYINNINYYYRIHETSITYKVRNYSSTYWPYRLNVYIEVCSYIKKYSELEDLARRLMRTQFYFCLSHLTEEQLHNIMQNKTFRELFQYKK